MRPRGAAVGSLDVQFRSYGFCNTSRTQVGFELATLANQNQTGFSGGFERATSTFEAAAKPITLPGLLAPTWVAFSEYIFSCVRLEASGPPSICRGRRACRRLQISYYFLCQPSTSLSFRLGRCGAFFRRKIFKLSSTTEAKGLCAQRPRD